MSARLDIGTGRSRIHCRVKTGSGPEILFLNGAFSTGRDWNNVIAQLSPDHHTVTFDARGRGRSADAADYSFAQALADVGRVIDATGLRRPILVGWSHGATLAIRHAATHPGTVAGIVLIDGAFPVRVFHAAGKRRIRRQYRMLRVPMRILGTLGLLSRLDHRQAAGLVLELDDIDAGLLPDYRLLDCPALIIAGSGAHPGSPAEEMATMRAASALAEEANDQVRLYATVGSNHLRILTKNAATVADAIRALR